LITAEGKFDLKFLVHNGVDRSAVEIAFDTRNAGHVLNEMRHNKLKVHAWLYTRYGGYDKELEEYKRKYPIAANNYGKIPFDILFPYATMDPIITFRVYEAMKKQFQDIDEKFPMKNGWSLSRYFYEIVMPIVNKYVDIELDGMVVNWKEVSKFSKVLDAQIKNTRQQIYKAFQVQEHLLNLDSGQELGTFVEEKMKWPCIERAKVKKKASHICLYRGVQSVQSNELQGYYKTNDDCLKKWKNQGYNEADLLLKYRELTTLQKTFVGHEDKNTGFWQYRKPDNKVHSNFGVMLTKSHRNYSENPNLQNCFSKDTEILTEKGWVRFDNLEENIKVAQYNEQNNEITFTLPTDYIKFKSKYLLNIKTNKQIYLFIRFNI
jgi:DNA polymerase I-like protein with 3'-5' exonuclease and polymerase domains